MKRKPCFTAPQCSTADCPNIQCDAFEDRYDRPASDAGLERVPCKLCHWNTGKCEDCLFEKNPDYCPKEQEASESPIAYNQAHTGAITAEQFEAIWNDNDDGGDDSV